MSRPLKEPTRTHTILSFLRSSEDFFDVAAIRAATGYTSHDICTALGELRHYGCVDSVDSDGRLWWFALPEHHDKRCRSHTERTPESQPRRKVKRKQAPTLKEIT